MKAFTPLGASHGPLGHPFSRFVVTFAGPEAQCLSLIRIQNMPCCEVTRREPARPYATRLRSLRWVTCFGLGNLHQHTLLFPEETKKCVSRISASTSRLKLDSVDCTKTSRQFPQALAHAPSLSYRRKPRSRRQWVIDVLILVISLTYSIKLRWQPGDDCSAIIVLYYRS